MKGMAMWLAADRRVGSETALGPKLMTNVG
jgi:hypothetical protein